MQGVGWLAAIIIGGFAGWIAASVMKTGTGLIANIILGILGAILGGIVWGWIDREEFYIDWSIGSLILGVIGAFVLSWGYAYLMGRKA